MLLKSNVTILAPWKKVWDFPADRNPIGQWVGLACGGSGESHRKQEQLPAAREADLNPIKLRRIHETGGL